MRTPSLQSAALLWVLPLLLGAQHVDFQQHGSVEYRAFGFPQTTYTDSAHFIGEALIRYDAVFGLAPGWKLSGGTETRSDTHRQAERQFRLNIDDRGLKRPNFSIRSISLSHERGPLTVEAGKQRIRWGRTALLNPTDRFAPRDYLAVVDNDVLAVFAGRVKYKGASNSLEIVAQPYFTPSRVPLLNQRWTVLPESTRGVPVIDRGSRLPGGTQWGARWDHSSDRLGMSLSFFDGHNHLPVLHVTGDRSQIAFHRNFPRLRMYGADLAVPVEWLTFKAEAAYFTSSAKDADQYALYVLQLGREGKAGHFSAGYAGEAVTARRAQANFAPDRGLAQAFLGRAGYNIGASRSVAFETAARPSGLWMKSEYSEKWGQYWSGTVGFTLLRGEPTDFLGQYRRNSFFNISLRYSFD